MADWIGNVLQVKKDTDKSTADAFFASIANKVKTHEGEIDLVIDFEKIKSKGFYVITKGDEVAEKAWGTKGCYYFGQHKRDDYTIEFLTARNAVPLLMQELSKQNPWIELRYICECYIAGNSDPRYLPIVEFIFKGGEIITEEVYSYGTKLYNECKIEIYGEKEKFSEEEKAQMFEKYLAEYREIAKREHETAEPAFYEAAQSSSNLLELPLEEMNLTLRPYNCLKRAGVNTVADIIALTLDELSNVRNIGASGVTEILEKLNKLGLQLNAG